MLLKSLLFIIRFATMFPIWTIETYSNYLYDFGYHV